MGALKMQRTCSRVLTALSCSSYEGDSQRSAVTGVLYPAQPKGAAGAFRVRHGAIVPQIWLLPTREALGRLGLRISAKFRSFRYLVAAARVMRFISLVPHRGPRRPAPSLPMPVVRRGRCSCRIARLPSLDASAHSAYRLCLRRWSLACRLQRNALLVCPRGGYGGPRMDSNVQRPIRMDPYAEPWPTTVPANNDHAQPSPYEAYAPSQHLLSPQRPAALAGQRAAGRGTPQLPTISTDTFGTFGPYRDPALDLPPSPITPGTDTRRFPPLSSQGWNYPPPPAASAHCTPQATPYVAPQQLFADYRWPSAGASEARPRDGLRTPPPTARAEWAYSPALAGPPEQVRRGLPSVRRRASKEADSYSSERRPAGSISRSAMHLRPSPKLGAIRLLPPCRSAPATASPA